MFKTNNIYKTSKQMNYLQQTVGNPTLVHLGRMKQTIKQIIQ